MKKNFIPGLKNISIPDVKWFLLLVCYAAGFLFLLISGKIFDYLHPRMLVFVIGAAVVLFIIAAAQVVRVIKKTEHLPFRKGFLIFILPLLLGFAVRNTDTSVALARSQTGEAVDIDTLSEKYTDVDVRNLLKMEVIEFDDNNYYESQFILYENAELFSGKEIRLTGFIYRDAEFKPGVFLHARYIMWCCAADAVLTGFVSEHPEADIMQLDTWARISGTLDITSYFDNNKGEHVKIPLIKVKTIEPVEPPKMKYIFAQ